ncbi:GNAT family N-acetyltransferase [Actinokineospora sp. NBRC 105648]|uniref:GNAT family N-acetyltransferase n=1 Tax=Actinokineospora sp. NBRC 105648 TaxID=3032206 RepID=UPI00249FD39A|nr:GNAT family N-acetyltransferase [Actinokineospora sp. NBRC 105648]GLZ37300.1 putative acetyltransferase [Actinokineospora sp. NBRC 105648]
MIRPSPVLTCPPVVLRRWTPDDLAEQYRLVVESLEHLKPWMAWALGEYTLDIARERILDMGRAWESEAEYSYAITVDGRPVGGCGLMSRIGPGGLELGYWLHPNAVGGGAATAAAAALVEAAFSLPEIDRVEIVHDTANTRSAAIPRRLGFREVARVSPPQEPLTSAENGVDVRWRLTRAEFTAAPG